MSGLILANAVLVAATALALARAASAAGAGATSALLSAAAGLWVAASRFWVRPHVFSWLFTALYLAAFFRYAKGGRRARWLLGLLPLQILWANTHAGGTIGLLLFGIFAAAEGLDGLRDGAAAGARRARPPALVALAGALATMVNPWGARILAFPFELTSMRLYMDRIYEWLPPWHISFNASPMFAAWIALGCSMLAAVFAGRPARSARGAPPGARRLAGAIFTVSPGVLLVTFAILRAAGPPVWGPLAAGLLLACPPLLLAAFMVLQNRAVDFTLTLPALAFMLLALRHNRAVADAALVGSVVLAAAASQWSALRAAAPRARGRDAGPSPVPPALRQEGTVRAAIPAALLLAATAALAAFGYPLEFDAPARRLGLGVGKEIPVCAVDHLARGGLAGRAFVSYAWAAPLVQRAYPRVKVGIDSRNDVYGEEIYRAHLEALASPASMERFLEDHRVDLVLLSYSDPDPAVRRWLMASPDWAPVHIDDNGFLLVRRSSSPPGLVERDEYRLLRPVALGATRITPANASEALVEANRAISQCQDSFFGWFYRAKALAAMGRWREAVETSRRATEIDPANATAWADLGYALAALGERERAAEMYLRALDLDPDDPVARDNLRRLRAP